MSESPSTNPLLGTASQVSFDKLQDILLHISRNQPDDSELESWLEENIEGIPDNEAAKEYINALKSLSLVEYRGNGYILTERGNRCYSGGEPVLLDLIDEELNDTSEILLLLFNGMTSTEAIEEQLEVALDDGDLEQEVNGRLQWLEQLSLVEVNEDEIDLTGAGEEVVSGIETTSLRYGFDEDMSSEAVRERVDDVDCYWVNNRNRSELNTGYLETPVDGEVEHDLTQINRGAVIFHYYEGELHGYSSPSDPVTRSIGSDGEPRYRLNVDYRSFDEPVPLRKVIKELLREEYLEYESYPFSNRGVREAYLSSLPTEAAEYLINQGTGEPPGTYGEVFADTDVFESRPELDSEIELFYPNLDQILDEFVTALQSGEHVILVGPPGTGKSDLATSVAGAYVDSNFKLVTATADWSTFDTIGGYQVSPDTQLAFTPGSFLNRFQDEEGSPTNEWLIIDELNRADIDKAFGSLFSALSGDRVTTTFEDEEGNEIEIVGFETGRDESVRSWRYYIPKDWRLLATMNTYDKMSLYDMSYAFMRRFAFVFVDAPTEDQIARHFDEYFKLDSWDAELESKEKDALQSFWQEIQTHRTLGPAIILKMARHLEDRGTDLDDAMTSAMTMFVIPQLEGLPEPRQINTVRTLIDESDIPLDEERFKRFASEYFDIPDTEFEEE